MSISKTKIIRSIVAPHSLVSWRSNHNHHIIGKSNAHRQARDTSV